jgi:hypothetical protein
MMQDAADKVHDWGLKLVLLEGNNDATPGEERQVLPHEVLGAIHLKRSLQTGPMNDVGLWDEQGESIGRAVAPIFALTNHSCMPNCAQVIANGHVQLIALCDIEAGEELTHSYVNLNGAPCDRKRTMYQSWQFQCRCLRCASPTSPLVAAFDIEHLCLCGGVVFARHFVAVTTPNDHETRTMEECQCNMLQDTTVPA